MRLISCDIENFGILSGKHYEFTDGLNVICSENGSGKSTLAAFIRVMFYGLLGDLRHDEVSRERSRYAPWSGGAFGGKLAFSANGKEYVITRIFGDKAQNDFFELRDMATNLISSDFTENIGEELFEIDAESFMRSFFVSQDDCRNTLATDDINAKLSNITEGFDMGCFAAADKVLKDSVNAFSGTRKTGLLYKLKEKEARLFSETNKGKDLEKTLDEIELRMRDARESISLAEKELFDINSQRIESIKKQGSSERVAMRKELAKELFEKEETLEIRRRYFRGEVPGDEACEKLETLLKSLRECETLLETSALSEKENKRYFELFDNFKDGIPGEEYLNELSRDAARLLKLEKEIEQSELTREEKEKLSLYSELYGAPDSSEKEISGLISKWNIRTVNAEKAEMLRSEITENVSDRKNSRPNFLLIFTGLIIFAAGFLIRTYLKEVISDSVIPWIYVSGVFIFLLGFVFRKKKVKDDIPDELCEKLNKRLEKVLGDIDVTDDLTEDFLESKGFEFDEESVLEDLSSMLVEIKEFRGLISKDQAFNKSGAVKEAEILSENIRRSIETFAIKNTDEDQVAVISDLRSMAYEFSVLAEKDRKYRSALAQKDKLCHEISDILSEYGIEAGDDIALKTEEVLDIVAEYSSVEKLCEEARERLKNFDINHPSTECEIDDDVNSKSQIIDSKESDIKEKIIKLQESLKTDSLNYDKTEELYEIWRVKCDELKKISAELSEKQHRFELIEKTEYFLLKAKENLTLEYKEPLTEKLRDYYESIAGEPGDVIYIDSSNNVTREEKGRQRSIESLSLGYRDICGFALRLSMADVMHIAQKPALILDDPFVNLDDEKLSKAILLMKEAAKNRQIVYLTCRETRSLG